MKKLAIGLSAIILIITYTIAIGYYIRNDVIRSQDHKGNFNMWVESGFLLQIKEVGPREIQETIKSDFLIWISGDVRYQKLSQMTRNKIKKRKELKQEWLNEALADPLNIKKYGNIIACYGESLAF
jgi:hypothetical protein